MPHTPSSPTIPGKYGIPLLAAFIVAGLAGNYFNYPIFLNIDFLFGSVFAMLTLQFFGIGRGIVAAAIIAGYTYVLWNHPYAIIIMTAEAAVVGWLLDRRKIGMVLADMLFWLIIGMPLVYLFYHGVMHSPPSSTYITMAKQAINGIANALVARLLFTGYVLHTRASLVSYREIVYNLLAFFVLCPTLILLAIGSRSDFAETDHAIRTSLLQDISRDSQRLETWVVNRKTAIIRVAEMAATKTPQQLQHYLEQTKRSDLNFQRVGLLDRNAVTTAYFPLVDELGQSNIGKNFADRSYVPVLKQTLKPMLSEVVTSKIGTPKSIVMMLAPVVIKGEYGGYVVGILSLNQVTEYLNKSTEYNAKLFTLIDKNGNVIMTNRTDQKVMTPFVRAQGTLTRLDTHISQWIPKLSPNTPASERWKKSSYVTEVSIGNLAEWKLILEQPIAPFQKALFVSYSGKLLILFLILLGALGLAEFLSRRFISSQEELQLITRDLPAKVAEGATIHWPESGIVEIHNLVSNFKETSDSLGAQFYEIRQINELLEQRVEERTVQLSNVMHELDIILGNAPVGIAKIVDRKVVWCNRKFAEMLEYSKDELVSRTTRKLYPSEAAFEQLGQEAYPLMAQGVVFDTEKELIGKDGTLILARYIGKAIDPADMAKGSIWLMEDISRRKQEEEERKVFELQFQESQRLESLGVLAGGIAHDFNNLLTVIIGNCALAKMDPKKNESRITEIEKASERAAALCRQMLEYAGHAQSVKSQINMGLLVSEMVEMLSSAGHQNITINPVITPNIPFIHGDASQIRQIALNLIINAIEAIGDAHGEITVMLTKSFINEEQPEMDHLGRAISAGTYVCLEVTDHGCGMDEETRRRIFEPFFTTKFTGRGLGLSATLGIITGHDGALQLFSRPGKGTTFKVYLPVQAAYSAGDESPLLVKTSVPWQGYGTVLLVEDEDNVRLIAKTILKEFGFDVVEAVNGREAIELYRKDPVKIRLVITDIGMPVMDGYELLFELKKLNPELPIIISTGFGDSAVTSRIPQEDLAGLICKPYTLGQMQDVLMSVVMDAHGNVA